MPRDDVKDNEGNTNSVVVGGVMGPTAAVVGSAVPYYYPGSLGGGPVVGPGGLMMGRPAVDPSGMYGQAPSQAWQSVWQAAPEDGGYGGGSNGQGSLDGQR